MMALDKIDYQLTCKTIPPQQRKGDCIEGGGFRPGDERSRMMEQAFYCRGNALLPHLKEEEDGGGEGISEQKRW